MFWMMNGWNRRMGPRGPMYGHRGYGHAGFGIGGLFLLPALLFGGWTLVTVIGSLIGAAVLMLGTILSGLAAVAGDVFSAVFSGSGLVLGIVIGLGLYFRMKKRNAEE